LQPAGEQLRAFKFLWGFFFPLPLIVLIPDFLQHLIDLRILAASSARPEGHRDGVVPLSLLPQIDSQQARAASRKM